MKIYKKAVLGRTLQNIGALFVLAILIIVIFLFTGGGDSVDKYNIEDTEIFDQEIFILTFLKSPVNGMTFRDLYVDSYYNDEYGDVKTETRNFFEVYNDDKCPISRVIITEMPDEKEVNRFFIKDEYSQFPAEPVDIGDPRITHKVVSNIDIPSREPGKYLNLKVSALC